MGDYLQKGTTYVDGGTVNASNLNAHVDDAIIKPTAISARTDVGVPGGAVEFLVNDSSTLKKCTLTNLATAVGSGGSSVIHGLTAVTSLSSADEFIVWEDGVAADRKITLANLISSGAFLPVGAIIDTQSASYTSNTSITSSIPLDDTTPTSAEGTEILSQAITPADSSNTIRVTFVGIGAVSSAGETGSVALFRNSTCINAQSLQAFNGIAQTLTFAMDVHDAPATTSTVTYSVRAGVSAGSLRFNGYTTGRKFGGASKATLVVQEIKG